MTLLRPSALLALLLGPVCAAWAQPATPLPDPVTPARIQLGPLGIRPALILRDVGYDSNVLNEQSGEQGDFTATMGARLDAGSRISRLVLNYGSFFEYVHFNDFESERGANRGAEGRVDVMLGRVRPHVLGAVRRSHERPTAEIDARALRDYTTVGAGLAAVPYSRTTLSVAYRRHASDFAENEIFRGVRLADELNSRTHSLTFGADIELSPFTTLSLHGEEVRERFTFSPDRDADTHRLGATALLKPLALVSGRATVGLAAFRPANALVPRFTGVTAAVDLGYAVHDESRLSLRIDRDVRHSFAEATPYYLATGVRGTFSQRLVRNIDAQVTGGVDRLAYEARVDTAPALHGLSDRVNTVGAGVGVRLGEESRVGLNFDYTTRTSAVQGREYARGRLFATVTYGF